MLNISLEHSGSNPLAGFLYVPITISFGFCQLSLLTAGLWTVPFRQFADLIKDNQKAEGLRALAVLGLAFLCL